MRGKPKLSMGSALEFVPTRCGAFNELHERTTHYAVRKCSVGAHESQSAWNGEQLEGRLSFVTPFGLCTETVIDAKQVGHRQPKHFGDLREASRANPIDTF